MQSIGKISFSQHVGIKYGQPVLTKYTDICIKTKNVIFSA